MQVSKSFRRQWGKLRMTLTIDYKIDRIYVEDGVVNVNEISDRSFPTSSPTALRLAPSSIFANTLPYFSQFRVRDQQRMVRRS